MNASSGESPSTMTSSPVAQHDGVCNRPVILAFSRAYLPGFRSGGPIRTLSNMVEQLGRELDFRVVTFDRDSGESAPYDGIDLDGWNTIGNAQVRYLSAKGISMGLLDGIIRGVAPDFIYLNSFFDPAFTQRVLLLKRLGRLKGHPVLLAPRGEFSSDALNLKSRKKRAYMRASRALGIYRGLTWQASSDMEKLDILRSLDFVPPETIKVARNIASVPDIETGHCRRRVAGAPLRICFLARVVPMKNLDFALNTLCGVNRKVLFTIYGPLEDRPYWNACEKIMSRLPVGVEVEYGGIIPNDQVRNVLAGHDLFFLPTRGENYGHVIHEALSAGLPVLISDRTPWDGLQAHGVGWALSLDSPERFACIIESVSDWSADDFTMTQERAISYAAQRANDKVVIDANRGLFGLSANRTRMPV